MPLLVSRLESEFYLDAERMRQAIRRGSFFNLVHLTTGFKVDVFVSGHGTFDRSELSRAALQRLTDDSPRDVLVNLQKTPSCASCSGTGAEGPVLWLRHFNPGLVG